MKQKIECLPVASQTDPLLERVEQTYVNSFPPGERRDFALVRDLMVTEVFQVYVLLREAQYAGFITAWQWHDFMYVEHFAIDESARNGGIGREALTLFLERLPVPVVLEVEMPTDEMSRRRIGFYQRLGFVLDEHAYRQPPYRPGESWLDMRLMTYGNLDLKKEFETIKQRIYRQVYGMNA
ncbi:GNAT family N-acetyltransferase [Parabacteroides sp. PF5-6]|uniref:GNAT family N-acetyltransferase n=1 Tax=Parabacteroides sp. PF5-6 TaxID=1742403 RepID=UPI00240755A2|nr:GNAT family N-acetyltransferase [Parabacteroides sp. PF5-6]